MKDRNKIVEWLISKGYEEKLNEFFDSEKEEYESLMELSDEIMDEYKEAYQRLAHEPYSFETSGRFGQLHDGEVVEITAYTEPDDDEQELYFHYDGRSGFAFLSDFLKFAHNESILGDEPIDFGDLVQLRDIPVSRFLELDTTTQENYDLYLYKFGLVTQVLEDTHQYAVAYQRDVILIDMGLVSKIYKSKT